MLTIAYVTSRKQPHLEWFLDSLARQTPANCELDVIIIDSRVESLRQDRPAAFANHPGVRTRWGPPKPTIWKGPHRITSADWWSKSSDMNCAICLCESSHICFVDDRSVLCPSFLYCVEEAIQGGYAVCGNYEKRANMRVENGEIIDPGVLLGKDNRTQAEHPYPTKDWYGGSGALPLEWCLAVNGFAEDLCDGLGSEDSMFGVTLRNNGFPIRYDSRMLILEDRTPGQLDGALKRADKGVPGPGDKSHAIVNILRDKTTSQNSFDIRNLRDRVLAGEPFPPPSASHTDWFDGQPISEMA